MPGQKKRLPTQRRAAYLAALTHDERYVWLVFDRHPHSEGAPPADGFGDLILGLLRDMRDQGVITERMFDMVTSCYGTGDGDTLTPSAAVAARQGVSITLVHAAHVSIGHVLFTHPISRIAIRAWQRAAEASQAATDRFAHEQKEAEA
jgi:hypothetical protein